MREAVIVSTARTPIGKAFRGVMNNMTSPTMVAHCVKAAVERSGVDPAEVEDLVLGTAMQGGTASWNLGRMSALAAGLPLSVSGQTLDRQCASGLMAIATAVKQVMIDGMDVVIGAGHENISSVQNKSMEWAFSAQDSEVLKHAPHAYMPMLHTAENVAKTYSISREAQDEYALQSQQRTAAAQEAGYFDAEIVPITASQAVKD